MRTILRKISLMQVFLIVLFASSAQSQVTDLPSGVYGGMFRDENTGKIWLDLDAFFGSSLSDRTLQLASSPFRLATAAEIQSLLQPQIFQNSATGGFLGCFIAPGPPDPDAGGCKIAVFDDSTTGTVLENPGVAGGFEKTSDIFFRNDAVDNESAALFGTWAVQRIPVLRPSGPYSLDFDGDGIDEKVVWRRNNGTFFVRFSGSNEALSIQWGLAEDTPIVGDFDGDQIPDLAVWRPSNGTWYILMSKALYDKAQSVIVQFGLPGDIAIRTDYDGDNRLDLAVWRPSNGTYYYVKSTTAEILTEQWGLPGDVPINGGR